MNGGVRCGGSAWELNLLAWWIHFYTYVWLWKFQAWFEVNSLSSYHRSLIPLGQRIYILQVHRASSNQSLPFPGPWPTRMPANDTPSLSRVFDASGARTYYLPTDKEEHGRYLEIGFVCSRVYKLISTSYLDWGSNMPTSSKQPAGKFCSRPSIRKEFTLC